MDHPIGGQCANGSFTGQLSVTLPAELSNATRDTAADVWVLGTPITPVVSLTGTWSDFEGVLTSQLASTVEPCLVNGPEPRSFPHRELPCRKTPRQQFLGDPERLLNYNYFSFLNDSRQTNVLAGSRAT